MCQKEGQEHGSPACKHFVQQLKTVVAFQGKDNPLSNFNPCEMKAFGEVQKSAWHAYQFTKAMKDAVGWNEEKETVIEKIIMYKVDQMKDFRTKPEIADTKTVFAEATFDTFWVNGARCYWH